jgi:hypothetical protein
MSPSIYNIAAAIVIVAVVLWLGVVVVGQIAAHLALLGGPWGFLLTVLVVAGSAYGVLLIGARLVKGRMTRIGDAGVSPPTRR